MAEMKSARCVIFAIVILQSLSLTVVEAAVNSSLSVGDAKGPPSAPRNLSRSVTGIRGIDREYRVFWTATKYNGGLPVNYTVKLCGKDNSVCGNSGSPDCLVTNVVSTSKGFNCVLSISDFYVIKPAGEYSEHDLCVEASNVAGKSETCIHADVVDDFGGTPRPPLNFSIGLENGQFTVRWGERDGWKQSNLVKKLYTVTYYIPSKTPKTKVVEDRTIATLTDLEPFTVYCVQLIIQFENENGGKTVPSDRLGPKCLRTPAGEPSNRPQIVAHKNYLFPEDSSVRDVAVEWKSALPSSWKGTPGQFLISCDYYVLNGRESLAEKCKYHTNATANSTVLGGLNSGDKYVVFMDKCNKEGKCSGLGRPYLIDTVGVDHANQQKENENTKAQIAAISLSVIIAGLASVVIAVCLIRKLKRKRRPVKLSLNQYLQCEPDPHHHYDEIHERRNEYDLVP